MAETPTAANNKSITFRGKTEREMSINHRSAEGKPNEDASFQAKAPNAKEADRDPAPKKPGKAMRKKAKRAASRGMISEKAAKKHLAGY
jgi:hypothetical protein